MPDECVLFVYALHIQPADVGHSCVDARQASGEMVYCKRAVLRYHRTGE